MVGVRIAVQNDPGGYIAYDRQTKCPKKHDCRPFIAFFLSITDVAVLDTLTLLMIFSLKNILLSDAISYAWARQDYLEHTHLIQVEYTV